MTANQALKYGGGLVLLWLILSMLYDSGNGQLAVGILLLLVFALSLRQLPNVVTTLKGFTNGNS